MSTLKETLRGLKVLVSAKTIKGTSFVGIKGYENSKGEISNQTLLVGFNLANLLKKDLETLKKVDISKVIEKYGQQVATTAYSELLESLAKRTATEQEKEELRKEGDSTMKRSDGQIDAYTQLAKGVKQHNENKDLKIYGLVIKKTVLVEGEYKPVNSRPKTLAKKDIKKLANLQETKLRTFTFNDASQVNLKGVSC